MATGRAAHAHLRDSMALGDLAGAKIIPNRFGENRVPVIGFGSDHVPASPIKARARKGGRSS